MKKLIATFLAATCLITSILSVPVSAGSGELVFEAGTAMGEMMSFDKHFNTSYADYKASITCYRDLKTGKMAYDKGSFDITSITMKNVPYMNQVFENGGLYKGSGSPTNPKNYTHKEWQNNSLYRGGAGNACGPYAYAMGVSFVTGKTVSPATYRTYEAWKENSKNLDFKAYSVGRHDVINQLCKGRPVVFCIFGTQHKCPFTDNNHVFLIYGVDEKGNCKIMNPNDYFCTDRDCPSANIKVGKTAYRHTSYIPGFKNSRTWPYYTSLGNHMAWGCCIEGPVSKKIRAEVDKWGESKCKELNKYYPIFYHLNGGKDSGNPIKYTMTTRLFSLKPPTRKGYTFIGWTGSNGTKPQKYVSVGQYSGMYEKSAKQNHVLNFTANWKKNPTTKTSSVKK